jgi:hypothetical protein
LASEAISYSPLPHLQSLTALVSTGYTFPTHTTHNNQDARGRYNEKEEEEEEGKEFIPIRHKYDTLCSSCRGPKNQLRGGGGGGVEDCEESRFIAKKSDQVSREILRREILLLDHSSAVGGQIHNLQGSETNNSSGFIERRRGAIIYSFHTTTKGK